MSKMQIIAEVGSNWRGLYDCLDSISAAAANGADVVKFQYYDHKALYGFDGEQAGSLPLEWVPAISVKAKAVGIPLMMSVFNPDDIDELAPYVDLWKVASCEFTYGDLYARMKATGRPIYASCGAHNDLEIEMVMSGPHRPDVLLYCVVAYPSYHHDVRHVGRLAARYPYHTVGYSDHSLDVFTAPLAAKGYGATVIEKHFKLDHIVDTPDAPHSLGPNDFQLMCKALKGAPPMGLTAFEQKAVKCYKRRLIASRDIALGEGLIYGENFGFYRSKRDDVLGGAFWDHKHVTGKGARKAYRCGDPINPREYQ